MSAPELVAGIVIGVEDQIRLSKDQIEVPVQVLNISTVKGIRSIPLTQVTNLRFTDKALQDDFAAALALIATSANLDKKKVSLHFQDPASGAS